MSALQQIKGPRPTLGGRLQLFSSFLCVSQAEHSFIAYGRPCALPGGGSGAARGAPGRNSKAYGASFGVYAVPDLIRDLPARNIPINPLLTQMFRARNISHATLSGGPQ